MYSFAISAVLSLWFRNSLDKWWHWSLVCTIPKCWHNRQAPPFPAYLVLGFVPTALFIPGKHSNSLLTSQVPQFVFYVYWEPKFGSIISLNPSVLVIILIIWLTLTCLFLKLILVLQFSHISDVYFWKTGIHYLRRLKFIWCIESSHSFPSISCHYGNIYAVTFVRDQTKEPKWKY